MTLVNGMQVEKAQGRAEVVYDGCQPLVAVENGLKLDWQSWEAAENKKPSASQQQRITVLARGPPSLAGTPTHWHLCNASHMGGHPIAAEAPHDFNPGPIVLTHPPPDGASFWKEASRMHRRRKKHSLAGAGLAGANDPPQRAAAVVLPGVAPRVVATPLLVGVEGAGTQWGSRQHPGSKAVAGASRPPPRGPP